MISVDDLVHADSKVKERLKDFIVKTKEKRDHKVKDYLFSIIPKPPSTINCKLHRLFYFMTFSFVRLFYLLISELVKHAV